MINLHIPFQTDWREEGAEEELGLGVALDVEQGDPAHALLTHLQSHFCDFNASFLFNLIVFKIYNEAALRAPCRIIDAKYLDMSSHSHKVLRN